MLRWVLAFAIPVVLFSSPAAVAQSCLHGRAESAEARQRRLDALRAARIINSAQGWEARGGRFLPWEQLGSARYVILLRGDGGPSGDLVRRMKWGEREVLPGWRIHFVVADAAADAVADDAYAFSLRDSRDPCGFTYSSNESGVVFEAYPVERDGSLPRRATP